MLLVINTIRKKVNRVTLESFLSQQVEGRISIIVMSIITICLILFLFNRVELLFAQQTNFSCDILPTQANTTHKLQQLRAELISHNVFAYVIFTQDEHGSGNMQLYDERRAWITGFLGSAGTAVVTLDNAALWTDGRYWTQAEGELDCQNWYLMRSGQSGVPSIDGWLLSQVHGTTPYDRVGVATQFVSSGWWSSVSNALNQKNATLVEVEELVDLIWLPPERPLPVANPVFDHRLIYSGIIWQEKVDVIAGLIQARRVNAYVVTTLDEIAWLFSLRGSDIPYNPFFKAYAIVYANKTTQLWMNQSQLTETALQQLVDVDIRPYTSFYNDLATLANQSDISTLWFAPSASQAIFGRVPEQKRWVSSSPIQATKTIKNPTEEKGMREGSLRDSVARVRHLAWLTAQINNDIFINETRAAEQLEYFQSREDLFQSLSFPSISAFGPNAAIIHYSPKAQTAAQITNKSLYLLDAGAQYLDCTIDITRTHVFGTATEEQKKAYTLVLQGSINLADAVFPYGTYGRSIDILARQPLFKNFMNYNHGTGHGIGHYLSIHEGPSFISMGYSSSDIPLTDGMVFSDEPGFYLPQHFGIRLETDIIVKNYTLPINYVNSSTQFLRFEPLTFVPFERELIICEMLTTAQKEWLSWYHAEVKNKLESTGRLNVDELNYLREKTQPITC
jgi:Xaa-Pro aminopeptidase